MPSVFFKTYGCQMNERDTEQVARDLLDRGYVRASSEREADVILLNTCSVRDLAEQKALRKMSNLKALRKKNPSVVLGFLGCMAQRRGKALEQEMKGLDLVVGTQKFHRVADLVGEARAARLGGRPQFLAEVEEEVGSEKTIRDHVLSPKQVTAFVSVMQGCDMHCSFCIVPTTRGKERSRPITEIVTEVRGLVGKGIREVTLLGQIVNMYGRREIPSVRGKSAFVQLLEQLQEVDGLERIRFTSPHPRGMKEDLIGCYGRLSKLCEHLHLPVQSGSDRLLKEMGRGYTVEQYKKIIQKVRQACPGIGLTTDVIVGYPGETEEEFQQTYRLMEEVEFDNGFIFRYSPRDGTRAAKSQKPEVAESVKEEWNKALLDLLDRQVAVSAPRRVGTLTEILVEGPSKTKESRLTGRSRQNRPVVFDGSARHLGQLLQVRITESTGFTDYADPAILE
ncbi:MAG: tRNA (N6-isopentenyl adenosine(37)-C2)-methylthiotransferase MiaB [Verrucomicrobiia bacterium Tous-C5FEB]|nr:MAG: tRNA (N6-isopentenyl adenosine(37)-C2)-methylthiotransferase MiaB [Verrucomicrobiae bacterium Tous-C5FEB]